MSHTRHTLRFSLQRTSVRATLHVAGLALACAAIQAVAPTTARAADASQTRHAVADFASCAKPKYPEADVQARHEGTVTVGFLVDATGKALESKVAKSSGFASLDEAARTALAQCSFRPALEQGKPVQQWTMVQYVWTLR